MAYPVDNYPVVSAFAYFLHFRYLRIFLMLFYITYKLTQRQLSLLLLSPPPLLPLICISLASYWPVNILPRYVSH